MRYFIGFRCYFLYVLMLFELYAEQGLSQLMLCPDSPQNQTLRGSVGSSATFTACIISDSPGLYGNYRVRYGFQKNESFRLLFAELADQMYRVELIIGDVQPEHFGTHIVSVINVATHQDVLNVSITLLEEDNTIIERVLPVGVTVGAALIIIASAIVLRKAGNRSQRYTINKKMYNMKKFFKRQKRKQSAVTIPVQNIDDNHYDTVNEVITGPEDNVNGTEITYEGVITGVSGPNEASLPMRYTTMATTSGGLITNVYAAAPGFDSDYITPIDVVKRSRRCKNKSKSLQRDALRHTAKKERYRLKSCKSMDSLNNAGTDNAEDYHHYCNCEPFKKTQEPTLLSIKQLRSSNQDHLLDDYARTDSAAYKHSVVGSLEADPKASKSTEYKCHKYVNLELFWDSFRGVNQELEQKINNKQSYGRKCEI